MVMFLELWSGMIGTIVILSLALYVVMYRDFITQSLAGLILVYAIQIVDTLNWIVRVASWLESNMIAVERVREYTNVKSEAEWKSSSNNRPSIDWPTQGKIQFMNYSTKYRPELELVLKDFTVTIEGGEKVGIIGRTGAGKSSLTLALFRIFEPTNGKIIIDGIDIRNIGLHDLRSKITIIPQEPSLFAGKFIIILI